MNKYVINTMFQVGASEYIIKPFDPDYLLTTLRSRARRSRRLRELIRQAESV